MNTVLSPAPSATPPTGYTYPQADTYHLNTDPDPRYMSQYYYISPYKSTYREILFDRMVRTISPPMKPVFNGKHMVWDRLAGQLELQEGYSMVQCVNGDPDNIQTRAVFHTPESLR